MLESREALQRRVGRPRGSVIACSGGILRRDHAIEDTAAVIRTMQVPTHVVSSADGSWIDRVEVAALRRSARGASVSSIYGHFPELFSVGPLAALAGVMLSRKLPALHGAAGLPKELLAATGTERFDRAGVLCTGFNGTVAGATVMIEG